MDVPIRRKSSASLVENALKKRLSASIEDDDVVDKKKEENIEERDTRRRYTVGSSVLLGSTAHRVAQAAAARAKSKTKLEEKLSISQNEKGNKKISVEPIKMGKKEPVSNLHVAVSKTSTSKQIEDKKKPDYKKQDDVPSWVSMAKVI